MGPVMAWFVNASDSLGCPLPSTLSVFLPSANPVTSPSTVFGARPDRNALETSRPFRLTIRERLEVPCGKEISTKTSPPLTRSGSVDTVLIANLSWRSRSSWPATEKLKPNAIATEKNLPRNRIIAILLVWFWTGCAEGPANRLDFLSRSPLARRRGLRRAGTWHVKTQRVGCAGRYSAGASLPGPTAHPLGPWRVRAHGARQSSLRNFPLA